MPYHPDTTTQTLFIAQHIHTPTNVTDVLCSICRQRCTRRHVLVQVAGHPGCQCVFGRTCLLQWVSSGSAARGTCPGCRSVLWNPGEGDSSNEDEDDELQPRQIRGHPRSHQRRRRGNAPSPSSSASSTSYSSDEIIPSRQNRQGPRHTQQPQRFDPRSYSPSSPSSASTAFSRTLSTSSTPSSTTSPINTFVSSLWSGTWDLVTSSWTLTSPNAPRSRRITRAQLVLLVLQTYTFDEEMDDMLLERLVIRARKMVEKHRKRGMWDGEAELRLEREDIEVVLGGFGLGVWW